MYYSIQVQRACQYQLQQNLSTIQEGTLQSERQDKTAPIKRETIDQDTANSFRVKEWKSRLAAAIQGNDTALIQNLTAAPFVFQDMKPCHNVFLDFGSNVGDSLRKFIDSALPARSDGKHPILDLTTGVVGQRCYDCERRTKDRWILGRHLNENGGRIRVGTGPEDYCFYGVEGNPVFTETLLALQHRVQHMDPRPIRHVHFLTRHVGAGVDGPTLLFLDTVNTKHNYWGSSVFASHVDVKASDGNTAVNVTGITLTTLLHRTVLPHGANVIIKIDIEGGEYALLEEAIRSGVFCDLRSKGAVIHMILEQHGERYLGTKEPEERFKSIKGINRIVQCGVKLKLGDAGR